MRTIMRRLAKSVPRNAVGQSTAPLRPNIRVVTTCICGLLITGGPYRPCVASDCERTSVGLTPLNDLGQDLYLDRYPGGLYPDGANEPPAQHRTEGLRRALGIQPPDADGRPDPGGKIVLLSIGMSNTTQEFCGGNPCLRGSFENQADGEPRVNHDTLVIVDGAAGGQTAQTWDSPDDPNYDRVRDTRLGREGVTEAQVLAVWVKVANATPRASLPDPEADAFRLLRFMGGISRALKQRYPNVQVVFFSSRIYAGYASTPLNPEPYAYESGFAVKWLIEAQIRQMSGGGIDPIAGDLDYDGAAPWLAWGAYLWADGLTPRSDGLIWRCEDLRDDGTHPSPSGVEKVGGLLLDFMLTSPFSRPWFAAPQGGIPCDEVRKFTVKCRRGELRVTVKLTTRDHDGETVTLAVDGVPSEVVITGRKARRVFNNQSGPRRVELVQPPGCVEGVDVSC